MAVRRDPGELIDPLEGFLGYQLRRAALATLTALDAAFEPLGLTPREVILLRFVGANPGCNQAAISRSLGVTRTNMVPFVSRLVEEGLIERGASDGRTHALFLTERGKGLDQKLAEIAEAHERRFFGAFDPATREALTAAFRQIRASAQAALALEQLG